MRAIFSHRLEVRFRDCDPHGPRQQRRVPHLPRTGAFRALARAVGIRRRPKGRRTVKVQRVADDPGSSWRARKSTTSAGEVRRRARGQDRAGRRGPDELHYEYEIVDAHRARVVATADRPGDVRLQRVNRRRSDPGRTSAQAVSTHCEMFHIIEGSPSDDRPLKPGTVSATSPSLPAAALLHRAISAQPTADRRRRRQPRPGPRHRPRFARRPSA